MCGPMVEYNPGAQNAPTVAEVLSVVLKGHMPGQSA